MKRIIMFVLLFAALKVAGQTTGYFRFDTVRIMKQNGTCELYLINKTKDSLGLLTNVGGGLTQFRKSKMLNDSTIIIGLDTLTIPGSGGTSGITELTGDVTAGPGSGSQAATLANTAVTPGSYTNADITVDAKGRVTAAANGSAGGVSDGDKGDITVTGSGSTWTIDNNAVTTAKIADNNVTNAKIVPFKTYPAEHTIGTIYERSKWDGATMAAEYTNVGGTTIALNGNYPRSTSSTIAWSTYHRALPLRPTLLPKWSFTVEFQIVSALASNVGFGPALRSNNVNGANYGYASYLACATSTGTPHLAKQDGTSDQTNGSFTVSQGDVIRMTLAFNDSVMTLTSQNITTSSSIITITKTFVAGTAPYVPNTGTLGYQNFSGTYEIRYEKFSSNATASPTLAVAADSKGQIVSSTFAGRFPSQLNVNYPTVINYSGNGDQLKDFIDKKEEVLRINPEQWWIILGSNDLRYGASLAVTMERMRLIKSWFAGTSTRVYWSVIPEDSTGSGIGLTAFKNALAAEAGSNYIDLWTDMSTNDILDAGYNSGDDVHPSQAGQDQIYALGVASGLLTVISPSRRSPYQKFGGGIAAVGDSLTTVYKLERAANNIPMFDDSANMKPSFIYHDATKMIISNNLTQATAFTGALVNVDGMLSMGGPAASFVYRDRNNPSNYHAQYSANNTFRFVYNGVDYSYIDATGRWKIGEDNATTIASTFHIRKSTTIGNNGITGVGFSLDTATYTVNPVGGYSFFSHGSFASPLITAASASTYTDATTLYVGGEPRSAGSATLVRPWSLYVVGKTRLGTTDSVGAATGGYLFKDAATGEVKQGPGVDPNSNALGHTLDAEFTTAGNSGTSETDLYSYSVPANKLGADGRTVNFEIDGEFNDNTATATVKLYFAGNVTLNTGAVNISTALTAWRIRGYIIRTSTTTAHVTYEMQCPGLATTVFVGYNNLTSLDFTTTNIFKITAQAGGAGAGNDDITAHSWQVLYKPQPQ